MIPIPERMRHLKVYRGYAVPWGVLIDADGTPQFAINMEEARDLMIHADLCGICGKPLFRGRWFVGGPASALHPRGAYIDMPIHNECKDYALQACPYLAAPAVRKGHRARSRRRSWKRPPLLMIRPCHAAGTPTAVRRGLPADRPAHG